MKKHHVIWAFLAGWLFSLVFAPVFFLNLVRGVAPSKS